MSSDWTRKQRRQQEVKGRAAQPNHMYGYCRIIGCNKPARAGTSDGLDEKYCRSHAEHIQRHGSPVKKSYTGKELTPYRRAALDWILAHEEDVWVQNSSDNRKLTIRDHRILTTLRRVCCSGRSEGDRPASANW